MQVRLDLMGSDDLDLPRHLTTLPLIQHRSHQIKA